MWVMVTSASTKIIKDSTIRLDKDGISMILDFKGDENLKSQVVENAPIHYYDAANTGTLRVGYTTIISPNTKVRIEASLVSIKKH